MRLTKPNLTSGPSDPRRFFGAVPARRKTVFAKLALGLLVLLIIAGAAFWFFIKDEPKDGQVPSEDVVEEHGRPSEANVGLYKDSDNAEEMRILVTSYVDAENYGAAVDTAEKLADRTKEVQDYMTLLWVCALHEVPGKQTCLDDVIGKLSSSKQSLGFTDAYSAGGLLEQANRRQAAADFFQLAYDKYDPALAEEGIRTKEQLKSHIDELRS